MPESASSRSAAPRAIALMVAALSCLILLDASGKWLGMRGVPVAATTWSRYAGHTLVVLALLLPTQGAAALRTAHPGRQIARGVLMVTVTLLYFAALKHLPLAQATAVFFTTPILVTLFASVFLRERPDWRTWAAVACGFAGVLVVVRPGTALPLAGVLLVLAAAAGNAAYQTLTRAQAHADAPSVQVLWSGLVGAALMTAAMPAWWSDGWWRSSTLDPRDWLVFAMVGPLGAAGHLLLARAYRLAQASRLAPWAYTQMVLSIALGWALFGDVPDGIALAGMALIAAGPQISRLGSGRG
ncbi:MAG TPA: DMT family transporter [Burkholderiaceae bacterium]|nr:DMT family transporter [Burkholderiaceae bacterium]